MLTRLYVDNFRCLVDFEYRPSSRELILGRNGSGKSSFLSALLLLRQFVSRGDLLDDYSLLGQRTRWLGKIEIAAEIEAELNGGKYKYRVVIEPWGDPARPRVHSETLLLDQKPIFEFVGGEVHLYNDRFEQKVTYDFDWHRSALATIIARKDNHKLTQFKQWFAGLFCFQINPFAMNARAEKEDFFPNVDLSNIASWYRHLLQNDPKQNSELLQSLRESLDNFAFLSLEPVGENVRVLVAEFDRGAGDTSKFGFSELSEGQRCLIALYTVLHFVVAKGGTVVIDEPDNFLSLREIQPWLISVADAAEKHNGQILIISHHPEVINQWAPRNGTQFVRNGVGPVRVQKFQGDSESCLSPAELIARGWESD
jgi:predicted ATPase